MKIAVRVKTNARKNIVQEIEAGSVVVYTTASPIEGKANEKVIELLAEYFGRPKRSITIIRGETSKQKVVEIL
jgi:uncharacterized protein